MTSTPQPQDREPTFSELGATLSEVATILSNVIERLDKLSDDVNDIKSRVDIYEAAAERSQTWQDRTWDSVKWITGIATALVFSITVGVFGIALRAILSGI